MSTSRILWSTRIVLIRRPCPSSWLLSPSLSSFRSPPLTPTQSRSTSSKSSSSSQWLSRQKRDPFVRSRTHSLLDSSSHSYVARSAFKLLELHQSSLGGGRKPLVRKGMTIVDLGASPGGWIQACRTVVGTSSPGRRTGGAIGSSLRASSSSASPTRIIGLDLLPLDRSLDDLDDPIEFVQGDFLDPYIQAQLSDLLGQDQVDLVLSDMLNNQSGSPLRDSQRSIDLCRSALQFAKKHLRVQRSPRGGEPGLKSCSESIQLVIKCLQSDLAVELGQELRGCFSKVRWEKPKSSRAESREGYWVCLGFKGDGAGEGAGQEPTGKMNANAGKVDQEEEDGDGLYF